jgi:hypothetical protein
MGISIDSSFEASSVATNGTKKFERAAYIYSICKR